MKIPYLGMLLTGIVMVGCFEIIPPADDSVDRDQPRYILPQDSLAIVEMKQSMGVWNGKIRDWIYDERSGYVRHLKIASSLGEKIIFPRTGLDSLMTADISINADTMIIEGIERLTEVRKLYCYAITPQKLKKWPRGMYANAGMRDISVSGVFESIDDSILGIDSLKFLAISANIGEIPAAFLLRTNLTLRILQNRICDPSPETVVWLDAHAPMWKWQNCPN